MDLQIIQFELYKYNLKSKEEGMGVGGVVRTSRVSEEEPITVEVGKSERVQFLEPQLGLYRLVYPSGSMNLPVLSS